MVVISDESFTALLAWLNPEPEAAGEKYEIIRAGLLRIFVSKGFSDAEDLADETIDRVIERLPDIRDNYQGEPARYFHGVARHILQETSRRKELTVEAPALVSIRSHEPSNEYECLDRCLKFLSPQKRELILDYHLYGGRNKIEHHKRMAQELAITENALRGRAHQIRTKLEKCVLQCAEKSLPVQIKAQTEGMNY